MDMQHRFVPARRHPAGEAPAPRSSWARAAADFADAAADERGNAPQPRRVEDSQSLLVPHPGPGDWHEHHRARRLAARRFRDRHHDQAHAEEREGVATAIGVGVAGLLCGVGLAQGLITGLTFLAALFG